MAQRISHKWKDEIKSFEANEHNHGDSSAGRIRGFDNIVEEAAPAGFVGVALHHDGPSELIKSTELNVLESGLGMHVTMNGSVVLETAPITGFQIPISLPAPANQRSWIIAEHEFTQLVGGSPCTYSLISGTLGTGTTVYNDPVLPNPENQVIIAQFDVPAIPPGPPRDFTLIMAAPGTGVIQQFSNGRSAADMILDMKLSEEFYTQAAADANFYDQLTVDALLLALELSIANDPIEAWVTPALHGSVLNNPSSVLSQATQLQYRRTLDNKTIMRGTIAVPNSGTAIAVLFNMPNGFRPNGHKVYLSVYQQGISTGPPPAGAGLVTIDSAGDVIIWQDATNVTHISFDGIQFSEEP